ncbi:tetratricopeptide repeat protein [Hymenobacter sp. BT507]|uniref:Tetratricopeptide repeat protein n=1 Tax=Hymenobacter citatus TaxID=2763506 RepID=A0ABR7MQK8_9BACT|nr:tetratricopeptide repeat protein [Hymenobacter citatus]
MGNTYAQLGNKRQAIRAYERALRLAENADTRRPFEVNTSVYRSPKTYRQPMLWSCD